MLSGWRRLNGAHRLDQTCFESGNFLQVQPLGLPAIRLILVDRSEIGFLSHCSPSPFSVNKKPNGSQVEFVPWRFQKEKALSFRMPETLSELPRKTQATRRPRRYRPLSADPKRRTIAPETPPGDTPHRAGFLPGRAAALTSPRPD